MKSKPLLFIVAALGSVLCHTAAQAQVGGVPLWTNRFNGTGNGADAAAAIAVDTNGNVFVTGYSTGSGSDHDWATFKYSPAGVPLWTNRYNGPGNGPDQANAVAVDGSGNVLVTGYATVNGTDTDFATIKYSNAGVPLWTNRFNGPGNGGDSAGAIALDANGNVFVTGYSYVFDRPKRDDIDYATIKYSGAGVPLWTNLYHGPFDDGDDYSYGLALDGGGNVFVMGRSPGGNIWPDYLTIKYSGAGVPLWTNRFNGTANSIDEPGDIAVDTNGNVFVTGHQNGGGDYATFKYSGAGVPLWTNLYSGLFGGSDEANAMAVDGSGNVLVTGSSSGSGTVIDFATIKYSNAGVPLWTNRYNGPGNSGDDASAMAVDWSENVFVSGRSFSSSSHLDFATVAYSGAGVPLWTNLYNGPGNFEDQIRAVAVDRSGNVFVTGHSFGNGTDFDYVTIKYAAMMPSLTITRTATNTVAVSWPSPSISFTLQQNTNGIATVNWSNVVTVPTDDGTTKTVIVNPPIGNRFFRLRSQ